MRALSPAQFHACAETDAAKLGGRTARKETALAFGIERKLAGGKYLDLDVVALALVEDLANAFGRRAAATLVRAHADKWLDGVGRADVTREPVFLMIMEYGRPVRHQYFDDKQVSDRMRIGVSTLADYEPIRFADHPKTEIPARMTWINLSGILARVRVNAAKAGLDFSAPFFPPPDDPIAKELIATAKKSRNDALALFHERRMAKALRDAPAVGRLQ